MRRAAHTAAAHPVVQQAARDAQTPAGLRAWLTERVRFQPDPPHLELLVTPLAHFQNMARDGVTRGDCDDVATLGAAMARAAGWRARFVLFGFFGSSGSTPYSHVFTEVQVRPGAPWVDLDVTRTAATPLPSRRATTEV